MSYIEISDEVENPDTDEVEPFSMYFGPYDSAEAAAIVLDQALPIADLMRVVAVIPSDAHVNAPTMLPIR